ncbi:MAG: hypothetical protein LBN19_00455 [Endomicrobium sp.]|jgi:hypothetical protein|nr:hypothetical protein [Endomicrobium sp.]
MAVQSEEQQVEKFECDELSADKKYAEGLILYMRRVNIMKLNAYGNLP